MNGLASRRKSSPTKMNFARLERVSLEMCIRDRINSVGVIDGDYYGNPGNEGHIFAQMKNITDQEVVLEVGERVVQAVFAPFLIADGDEADGVRTGGFGSTGK